MLEIETTVREMKNAFDAFISRLDMAKEEPVSLKSVNSNFQNEKAKEKII